MHRQPGLNSISYLYVSLVLFSQPAVHILLSCRSCQASSARILHLMYMQSCHVSVAMIPPRSRVLRTQKLKANLLRTHISEVFPLQPGVDQYIAMHAAPTAWNVFLVNFYLPSLFNFLAFCCCCCCVFVVVFFFFLVSFLFLFLKPLPSFYCVSSGQRKSGVGPKDKAGHPAHCYRSLMQVPVFEWSQNINGFQIVCQCASRLAFGDQECNSDVWKSVVKSVKYEIYCIGFRELLYKRGTISVQ